MGPIEYFSAFAFIGSIIVLALVSYFLARLAFRNRIVKEETRELAVSVLFRIGALHGLVLALVFAQDLAGVRNVTQAAAREASLVSDIYHDAERYGHVETHALRQSFARYALIVTEEEWPQLASKKELSELAWQHWEAGYALLLRMTPETSEQSRLHQFMLEDVREISELRERRENAARGASRALFSMAALVGIVLISAAFFTWPATALNLTLVSMFAAYSGLILFMTVSFSNPFEAPGRAPTSGFERFLTIEVREMAATDFDQANSD